MSADAAAAKLIEMIHSKKVDDRTKLMAVKDLLDRANLSGKQSLEIGVVQPRSFEDFVGDALVLISGDEDIMDAEVVEDDGEWEDYNPDPQTRHDRLAFAEVEQAKQAKRRAPAGLARSDEASAAERAARDEEMLKVLAEAEARKKAAAGTRRREAYLLALDAGASDEQAHAAGERAFNGESLSLGDRPRRRARQSTAQIVTD